ncbi:MAG TPA: PQQ-dependent dehydrogenase, methanol/ethanol family [Alphaproteobacteria bacterium]|jgi:quinohemoprotein ethanol dehydrogenase|nr:PQQ-dependent dehydrogenase, methanol/ethanol family [Alphaproteobacteria bacterium]
MARIHAVGLLACAVLLAVGAARDAHAGADIDQARLKAVDAEPQNWLTLGRDGNQTYFSPLTKIDQTNVGRLGYAWSYDMPTARGQEATPIVVDGVMYTSGTWGYVYAVDAATGKERWSFDPEADPRAARNPCCDLVNRGVAVWKGKVFVASVDGRLHALDAATGKELWKVDTITDRTQSYASTGAVYIAGDVAVIGNAGSDMDHGGVRGYVSAYDTETGAFKWRFYTVPGERGKPYENPELAEADKTWPAGREAQYKGGGTVWDGFAYDPDLDLVYFGTANAAPYDLRLLGPGPTDALFTATILALHAKTGRVAWHYQTTPGDHWDFDATQKLILADLPSGGARRQVIMQANKNGFFYVLDRRTGQVLSAKNFVDVNWASGIDMKTGRPIVTPQSDWYQQPKSIAPSWAGGHTWPAMSYDAKTGLVYIPTLEAPAVWLDMARNAGGSVRYLNGFFTGNSVITDDAYDADALRPYYGEMPGLKSLEAGHKKSLVREQLRAWDPVRQTVVWEHETSAGLRNYDGGVMSTAGNLVFQGRGSGELWVYAADTGKVLKVIPTGSHIMAAPMTYAVDGVQYVAVQGGYGGTAITVGTTPPGSAAAKYENVNRIIVFKLDGGPVPTPPARHEADFPKPPASTADAAQIHRGDVKFIEQCSRCHALGPSVTPDLRKLSPEMHAAFGDIVLKGASAPLGMESFADILDQADVDAIHAYLIDQNRQGYEAQEKARGER